MLDGPPCGPTATLGIGAFDWPAAPWNTGVQPTRADPWAVPVPLIHHRRLPEPGTALCRPGVFDNDEDEVCDMGAAENADVVRRGYEAFNAGGSGGT